MEERSKGYKNYIVKLFQNNLTQDLGSTIRANHKSDGTYTMLSANPYEGTMEKGREQAAKYALGQLALMNNFSTKYDAINYAQGVKNLIYGLTRYTKEGQSLDSIKEQLTGDDKNGYNVEFKMIYAKEANNGFE